MSHIMPPVSQLRKPAVAKIWTAFEIPKLSQIGLIQAGWRPAVNDLESELPVREESATALRSPSPLREIDSSSLLQGENEILIRHGDEVYRLRLTKNGKLILQK